MLTFLRFALGLMLVLTALFLILLVLIQRGRGGGLTGALGGAGGQSAFGTKAGDVFTRITVGVAAFWIGLCILALNMLGQRESLFSGTLGGNAPQAVMPTTPTTPPAGGQPAPGSAPGASDVILPEQTPATPPPTSAATPSAETAAPPADVPPPPAPDAAPVPSAPAEAK